MLRLIVLPLMACACAGVGAVGVNGAAPVVTTPVVTTPVVTTPVVTTPVVTTPVVTTPVVTTPKVTTPNPTTKAPLIISKTFNDNEKLILNLNSIYSKLAHTDKHSSDRQKRAYSIMLITLLQILEDSKLINHKSRVESRFGSVNDTAIPHTAAVLGGQPRRTLDILRSHIEKPILVIQRYCKDTMPEIHCRGIVEAISLRIKNTCHDYDHHVRLRHLTSELNNDVGVKSIFYRIAEKSKLKGSDMENFLFVFDDVVLHIDDYVKLLIFYKELKKPIYTCRTLEKDDILV